MQAGRVGKATEIVAEMFSDPEYTTDYTLRPTLSWRADASYFDLIKNGYVDALCDERRQHSRRPHRSDWRHHYIGKVDADDEELYEKGINRAYDIYFEGKVFEDLEKSV
jgi:deoxyhypusine synthase